MATTPILSNFSFLLLLLVLLLRNHRPVAANPTVTMVTSTPIYAPLTSRVIVNCTYETPVGQFAASLKFSMNRDRNGGRNYLAVCKYVVSKGTAQCKDGYAFEKQDASTMILKIDNLTRSQIGAYECSVIDSEFDIGYAYLDLEEAIAPTVALVGKEANGVDVISVKGMEKRMNCMVDGGIPNPSIVWTLNGDDVTPNTTTIGVGDRNYVSTILLHPTEANQNATLKCSAENEATLKLSLPPVQDSATLKVYVPPSSPVIEGYEDGNWVHDKDSLYLSCRVENIGDPAAVLTFRQDSTELAVSSPGTNEVNV